MNCITQFKTNKSRICMMGCIVDILNYYGFYIDESIIFALSSGNYFCYKNFGVSNKITGTSQIILSSMQYDLPKIFSNISKVLRLETEINCSVIDCEIQEFIKDNIDKKQPVISIVSREHLDYMEKRSRDKVPHVINITGYNFLENKITVSDTYIPSVPVTTYSGSLSWDNFKKALLSPKDMFNKNFAFRSIVYVRPKSNLFAELSLQKKLQPLREMAMNYYQIKYLEKDIMYGQFALQHFINDLVGWLSMDKTPSLLNIFRTLSIHISNFGGQFITNQLMAGFMDYLLYTYQTATYQKLKDGFEILSNEWFVVANLLLKASFGKIEDVKKSIHDRLKVIYELENTVYQSLLDV